VLLLSAEPIPAEVREQFLISAVTAFVLAGPGTDAEALIARLAIEAKSGNGGGAYQLPQMSAAAAAA
jgi:hypothetical protein